jgi:opacity protein-like surface antigen
MMPIRCIAPLAVGLVLAPSVFAQDAQPPQPSGWQGRWYFSASAAVVDGVEYSYDDVLIPDLLTSSNTVTTDVGAGIETAVGYAFSSGFRTEAALTLQKFDGTKTSTVFRLIDQNPPFEIFDTFAGDRIESTALNLNAYYDFPTSGSIRPYAGIGVGIVSVEVNDGVLNAKDPGISLQAMAGLSFKATEDLSLYVEGRWQELRDLRTHGFDLATSFPITVDFDFSTFSIRSGLRATF